MLGERTEKTKRAEEELNSYLQYLNSAMAPFEMRKLKDLIGKLSEAKLQEGKDSKN